VKFHTDSPLWDINILEVDSICGPIAHTCADESEIGMEELTSVPDFTFIGAICCPCRVKKTKIVI